MIPTDFDVTEDDPPKPRRSEGSGGVSEWLDRSSRKVYLAIAGVCFLIGLFFLMAANHHDLLEQVIGGTLLAWSCGFLVLRSLPSPFRPRFDSK
jgi:hypothetical protein